MTLKNHKIIFFPGNHPWFHQLTKVGLGYPKHRYLFFIWPNLIESRTPFDEKEEKLIY